MLNAWVGQPEGGILNFATYSYETNGPGSPNLAKNIAHKDRHLRWHFIYFGYSWKEKRARAFVRFFNDDQEQQFKNINHFLTERFLVYLGVDIKNPNHFNGKLAYVAFTLGKGAF